MRHLTALLVLAACGGFFRPAGACHGEQLVFVEDARDCACLQRQADAARAAVAEYLGDGQLDVRVWVHASDTPWPNDHAGLYHPGGEIELERYGRGWAHELLHHLDMRDGATAGDTAVHRGWSERGWLELGDRFWREWDPKTGGHPCW